MNKYKVGDRVYYEGYKYTIGSIRGYIGHPLTSMVIFNKAESFRLYADDRDLKPIITVRA